MTHSCDSGICSYAVTEAGTREHVIVSVGTSMLYHDFNAPITGVLLFQLEAPCRGPLWLSVAAIILFIIQVVGSLVGSQLFDETKFTHALESF